MNGCTLFATPLNDGDDDMAGRVTRVMLLVGGGMTCYPGFTTGG
jgi:hypothetical protein